MASDLIIDDEPRLVIAGARGEPPTIPINVAGFQETQRPMIDPRQDEDPNRSLEELLFDGLVPMREGIAGQRTRTTERMPSLPPHLLNPLLNLTPGGAPAAPAQPVAQVHPIQAPAIQPIPSQPTPAKAPPLPKAPPPPSSASLQSLPLPKPVGPPPPPAKSQPMIAPPAPLPLGAGEIAAPPQPSTPFEGDDQAPLPANVLIVDDDARSGSLVATRLLELGYGCLVSKLDAAARALSKGRFDAVVLEVPPDDARRDGGAARIAALGAFTGPVIVTSAAVMKLDRFKGTENVFTVLTKPYFIDVLVQAIEAARGAMDFDLDVQTNDLETAFDRAWNPATPKRAKPAAARSGDRRIEDRYELDVNIVRAVITGAPDGNAARGRVRNVSLRGGMLVETQTKFQLRTILTVECGLLDGRKMIFTGRVLRSSSGELAIRLDCDETQRQFLEMFVKEACVPNQRAIQPVRIAQRVEGTTEDIIDDMALMRCWVEVSEKLDDDAEQQRFIQMCLRAERLEFGIARYRDLKAQRPDDERVARYLQQIGTILGFYAFSKKDAIKEKAKLPSSLKIVIGIFILAGLALVFILHRAMR
jgi:CheY-like chemotaxis protein